VAKIILEMQKGRLSYPLERQSCSDRLGILIDESNNACDCDGNGLLCWEPLSKNQKTPEHNRFSSGSIEDLFEKVVSTGLLEIPKKFVKVKTNSGSKEHTEVALT
jgi:hypothetical protein